MARTVKEYIERSGRKQALMRLRKILLSTELEECVKWGAPCYAIGGRNVVGMGAFKSYFGLWFHQGALLADKKRVLVNAQKGKTKALRQWRMQSAKDIDAAAIKTYVEEAIKLAKEGRAVPVVRKGTISAPPELKAALARNKAVGASFKKLRPGLQKEYAAYIAEAKRDETKARRIEKILPMIKAGQGLNDKYR